MDLLAPGVDILSTGLVKGRLAGVLMSSTSMASVHVSGAALLYLSKNPGASPSEVRDALRAASKPTIRNTPSKTTDRTVWVGDNFLF